MTDVDFLLQRVESLEKKRFQCPHDDIVVDEQMRRARKDVEDRKLFSSGWKWVPKDYYSWPLSKRAKTLGAPSTDYLCKSLLMENRKAPEASNDDTTNPRFILVVLHYETNEMTTEILKASTRKVLRLCSTFVDSLCISQGAACTTCTAWQGNS